MIVSFVLCAFITVAAHETAHIIMALVLGFGPIRVRIPISLKHADDKEPAYIIVIHNAVTIVPKWRAAFFYDRMINLKVMLFIAVGPLSNIILICVSIIMCGFGILSGQICLFMILANIFVLAGTLSKTEDCIGDCLALYELNKYKLFVYYVMIRQIVEEINDDTNLNEVSQLLEAVNGILINPEIKDDVYYDDILGMVLMIKNAYASCDELRMLSEHSINDKFMCQCSPFCMNRINESDILNEKNIVLTKNEICTILELINQDECLCKDAEYLLERTKKEIKNKYGCNTGKRTGKAISGIYA